MSANAARDEFPKRIRERLALRAAHRCSNPSCGRTTVGPSDDAPDAVNNVGVAAHISGAAPGGPRYDTTISPEQRTNIANGIWLCGYCERMIDRDEAKYTVSVLRSWKKDHEVRCSETLEGKRAAGDEKIISDLAGSFGLHAQTLEELSAVPEPSTTPTSVEFVVSAVYSEDKNAIIVVAELGNGTSSNLTVRDARLELSGADELIPRDPILMGGLEVSGYTWLGLATHVIASTTLDKVAWLFDAPQGLRHQMARARAQPLRCELSVRLFPHATLVRTLEVFSIGQLGGAPGSNPPPPSHVVHAASSDRAGVIGIGGPGGPGVIGIGGGEVAPLSIPTTAARPPTAPEDQLQLPAYVSHYFATESDEETCILDDARVLIFADVISGMTEFLSILEAVARERRPLLVVAEDVTGEALSALIENKRRGILSACAVGIGTGDHARRIRRALSRFCGARVLGDEAGFTLASASLADLGEVDRVTSTEHGTQLRRRVSIQAPS